MGPRYFLIASCFEQLRFRIQDTWFGPWKEGGGVSLNEKNILLKSYYSLICLNQIQVKPIFLEGNCLFLLFSLCGVDLTETMSYR